MLDDHLDGLLPAGKSERIRDHLSECSDCEAEALAAQTAAASMSSWGDLEPPAGCFERILDRIEAIPPEVLDTPARPRFSVLRGGAARWLATTGAAAAAAVIVGISSIGTGASDGVVRRGGPVVLTPTSTLAVTTLRDGEEPLTPDFHFGSDLELDDGLRRRRVTVPAGPAGIPANFEPFGERSR